MKENSPKKAAENGGETTDEKSEEAAKKDDEPEKMDVENSKEDDTSDEKEKSGEGVTAVSRPSSPKDESMAVDEADKAKDDKVPTPKPVETEEASADENAAKEVKTEEKPEQEVVKVEEKECKTEEDLAASKEEVVKEEEETCAEKKTEADPAAAKAVAAAAAVSSYFGSGNGVPMIMWPKDRVIVNRLENIIQMFENSGEWPQRVAVIAAQSNPLLNGCMLPNSSATSLLSQGSSMAPSNSFSISNLVGGNHGSSSLLADQRKLMMSPMLLDTNNSSMDGLNENDMYDYENSNNDSEFSTNTPSSSKYQKPKRGRPPKLGELPLPPGMLMPNTSNGANGNASSSDKMRQHMMSSSEKSSRNSRNLANMAEVDDSDEQDYDDYEQQQHLSSRSNKMSKADQDGGKLASKFLEPGEICRPKSTRAQPRPDEDEEEFMANGGKQQLNAANNNNSMNRYNNNSHECGLPFLFCWGDFFWICLYELSSVRAIIVDFFDTE